MIQISLIIVILNFTNVYTIKCGFYAFAHDLEDSDAYILNDEEILKKLLKL